MELNYKCYFIAKIDKTYEIIYYKVDSYKYNEYVGTGYMTICRLKNESAYLEAVK